MWTGLTKFATFWTPVLILGIWSGAYLFECAEALAAPGTGFKFDYVTERGTLEITTQSYKFDRQRGIFQASNAQIKYKGKVIAFAQKVDLRGLSEINALRPVATLSGVELWVERLPNGNIDIAELFSGPKSGGDEVPFEVRLDRGVLHVTDQASTGNPKNDIRVTNLTAVGLGDAIRANATTDVVDLGAGKAQFIKNVDGWDLKGSGWRANLPAVKRRLSLLKNADWMKSLSPLTLQAGSATGDYALIRNGDRPLKYWAKLNVAGTNVKWDKFGTESLTGRLDLDQNAVTFNADAKLLGASAKVSATIPFNSPVSTVFGIKADNVTTAVLVSNGITVPKELKFTSAATQGRLTLSDGLLTYRGTVSGKRAQYLGYRAESADAEVFVNSAQVSLANVRLGMPRTTIAGFGSYRFKDQFFTASGQSDRVVPAAFGLSLPDWLKNLSGSALFVASGEPNNWKASARIKVSGDAQLGEKLHRFSAEDVVLEGAIGGWKLARTTLKTDAGMLFATGKIGAGGAVDIQVQADNVQLQKLVSEGKGIVDFSGRISGRLQNPQVIGNLSARELGVQGPFGSVSAASARIEANLKRVLLKEIAGVTGAGLVSGDAAYTIKDGSINGKLKARDLSISDFYNGPVAGVVDLSNVKLSGTVTKPKIEGDFLAKSLVANTVKADMATGKLLFDAGKLSISNGSAVVGGGTVSGVSATYAIDRATGEVSALFDKLKLSELALSALSVQGSSNPSENGAINSALSLGGTTTGKVSLKIEKQRLKSITSSGYLDDVFVNKSRIGSGPWSLAFDGGEWTGDLAVGNLDDYLQVNALKFNPISKTIEGDLTAFKLPVQELVLAAEPLLGDNPQITQRLRLVDGKIGFFAQISGTVDDATAIIPDFSISRLVLGEEKIGELSLGGEYTKDSFIVKNGKIEGPKDPRLYLPRLGSIRIPDRLAIPLGNATFSGNYDRDGKVGFTGNASNITLSRFYPLFPILEKIDAVLETAKFSVTGTAQAPVLKATAEGTVAMTQVRPGPAENLARSRIRIGGELNARIDTVENKIPVDLKAKLSTGGVAGFLELTTKLPRDFSVEDSTPIAGKFGFNNEQSLMELLSTVPELTIGKDGAWVNGTMEVAGTIKNPQLTGGFSTRAQEVRYNAVPAVIGKPLDAALLNARTSLKVEKNQNGETVLVVAASTSSTTSAIPSDTAGPEVRAEAKILLESLLNGQEGFSLDKLEIRDGSVRIQDLTLMQTFTDKTVTSATFYTPEPLILAGTVAQPSLAGKIHVKDARSQYPKLFASEAVPTTYVFDPKLDIDVVIDQVAQMSTALADVAFGGSAKITGTLSDLNVSGAMSVEKGELQLPGGKVKLERGGEMKLDYRLQPSGGGGRFDVKMVGTTSLTALKIGDIPERYEITIELTGDLLKDNGLKYNASSVPGDLSQDRIFQLLGRTDLLANALTSGATKDVQSGVRDALASVFLPRVFSGFTDELAKSLGLDNATVEYNAYDQASISFIKALTDDFFLQGRRQISNPLPGQKINYDLRITYRPVKGRSGRALSISVGTDQNRPYKLSLNYSGRLREPQKPYRTIGIGVKK
jgi:hypothetical protein